MADFIPVFKCIPTPGVRLLKKGIKVIFGMITHFWKDHKEKFDAGRQNKDHWKEKPLESLQSVNVSFQRNSPHLNTSPQTLPSVDWRKCFVFCFWFPGLIFVSKQSDTKNSDKFLLIFLNNRSLDTAQSSYRRRTKWFMFGQMITGIWQTCWLLVRVKNKRKEAMQFSNRWRSCIIFTFLLMLFLVSTCWR